MDEMAEWGCKWGAFEVTREVLFANEKDSSADYSFKTPWTPATELLNRVAASFSSLKFELNFETENAEVKGRMVWADGRKIFDETRGGGA